MFKVYFKTAFRNLVKHKAFSIINISGLALGIAACLLILQYVWFEWSYDNFTKRVTGSLGCSWIAIMKES
jgi:putative ABC transport system permease protein